MSSIVATPSFNAEMSMAKAFETAAAKSTKNFAEDCVKALAKHYGLDQAQALAVCGLDKEIKITLPEKKVKKEKRQAPAIPLPWTGQVKDEWCCGLRPNHGLYTQCTMLKPSDGDYCMSCKKQADLNASGKPKAGCVADRLAVGIFEYVDPSGKAPTKYGNVMEKKGITREEAEEEAEKFGFTIPEEQFEVAEVVKKAQGRPKQEKQVESVEITGTLDQIVATAVKKAEEELFVDASSVEEDQASKAVKAKATKAKAVKTKAKAEAKEKAEAKAKEKAEAKAKAEAEAKAKAEAEAKAKAEAEAKAKAEAEEEEGLVSDDEEEECEIEEIEIDGVPYMVDDEGIVYQEVEGEEPEIVGYDYDPDTNTFTKYDGEDE